MASAHYICVHLLGVKVAHWEAHVLDANLLAALLDGVNVNTKVLHVTVLLQGHKQVVIMLRQPQDLLLPHAGHSM